MDSSKACGPVRTTDPLSVNEPVLLDEERSRISDVLSTRAPGHHASDSTKAGRGLLWGAAAQSEFKRLDELARQRSDCCSSGTSSCHCGSPSRDVSRAGAAGGPVVGRHR